MADTLPKSPVPGVGPLPPGTEDLGPAGLAAACRAHQRQRWLAGERVPAEAYLAAYPRLADEPEAALDVVYGEFLLREELGLAPTTDEYLARFPHSSRKPFASGSRFTRAPRPGKGRPRRPLPSERRPR
jgi:hypothetical protein